MKHGDNKTKLHLKTRLERWSEGCPVDDSRDFIHDKDYLIGGEVMDTIYKNEKIRIIKHDTASQDWTVIFEDKSSTVLRKWNCYTIEEVYRLIRNII